MISCFYLKLRLSGFVFCDLM